MNKPARPTGGTSPVLEALYRHRLAIGAVVLVVMGTIGWFFEDLMALFERKPSPTAIAGAWTMDEAEYAANLAMLIKDMPEAQANELRGRLGGLGASYRNVVYTFMDEGYERSKGATTTAFACTYVGVAPNVLVVQPKTANGGGGLTLILDLDHGHLYISGSETAIPLARVH